MNKQLEFPSDFIPSILKGEKSSTRVIFDDKDFQEGDLLDLVNIKDKQVFAIAKIDKITTKEFFDAYEVGKNNIYANGHEIYTAADAMYGLYKKQYGDMFTLKTPIKIISFKLI